MQLDRAGEELHVVERPLTEPAGAEVLIEVAACGVCRTDLHIMDGEIHGQLPIVPGHEIVGRVIALGPNCEEFGIGDRVGVPWLGGTDGTCFFCTHAMENLCDAPVFTGFTRDGGYATHVLADSRFCLAIPDRFADVEAAPLLCAGLIGYRALKTAGTGEAIGLYGFGAAAHIIAQVAAWQGRRLFAFTRDGDEETQAFAQSLGCAWAGGSSEPAPEELDSAIIFAPVGPLVPKALKQVRKGGRVICAGIHMSDIPAFPYENLWGERTIASVANLTRADGREFMEIAAKAPIRTRTTAFPLLAANEALGALRSGALAGAAVLVP
ncbi:MAG TPA: zinc-dependent alcohol dehydrogenase family protein [Sphingomicrobium sp.]|jgi:propanol-preferring alcohol dehydrogenase|nr:zinc-dependent alcohol dehydrogenase family protein [Sphingomicrobium sp.]